MKKIFLLIAGMCLSNFLSAQELQNEKHVQTIRGKVVDQISKTGISGASIIILDLEPVMGTITNQQGDFYLPEVPIGRVNLQISFVGYENAYINGILVTSGKEIVLNVALQESLVVLAEVVITEKTTPQELAIVNARGFTMEETSRYAGSRNDPARMVQNFAGVSGANDSRNDIIIRGNSPTGVLWRLEGVDIPNPNHFGALGTTGGPVSMLNNNLLSKSYFMTGAFPANYGNAVAGLFDLRMRKGNAFRKEHIVQIGFNGLEIGTEGPLGGESDASYLLNYRYSTLGLMQSLGFSAGTGNAVPYYQDFSLKVDVPTKKVGRFSLFAIAGKSNIDLVRAKVDTTATDFYSRNSQDIYNRAKMGVAGISHTHYYGEKTYGVLSLSADYTSSGNVIDSLSIENQEAIPFYRNHYNLTKYRTQYQFHHKVNSKNSFIAGLNYDNLGFRLQDSIYRPSKASFVELRKTNGYSSFTQGFVQWQHRFNNVLSGGFGLHYQHFSLNGSSLVEPRLRMRYVNSQRSSIHLGMGLHSQLQPIPIYFLQSEKEKAANLLTNKNLDFVKSMHFVVGYDYRLTSNIVFKTEAYYQHLYDVAVEQKGSSFSMLNAGADFNLPIVDSLTNSGIGRNYGVEVTVEKSFSNSSYFLLTASLFDTRYRGSDGQWRSTAFNSQFVFNGLYGREWVFSRNKVLSIDLKSTYAGGQYFTPIDLKASRAARREILTEAGAFSEKKPSYLRSDLKITLRVNKKKVTHEWGLDIQNIFNTRNIFRQTYNPLNGEIVESYQIGILPIPQYRLTF